MLRYDAVTVMLRRLAAVGTLLLISTVAGHAQYTPGSWPATFLDYTDSTGGYIQDISDQNPSQLDVIYAASTPSSVLVGADGTHAFFRMQLADNPYRPNGNWSPYAWVVAISDSTGQGAPIGWVSVNATGSGLNVEVKDNSVTDLIYSYPASTATANMPAVRSLAAGSSGYFYLDFQVPIAALSARFGISASTPMRFFYGTSASAGSINKDYMTGSTVSFLGLTTTSLSSMENGSLVLLPVELTSFNVFLKGSTAELRWSTATEVNNYGFAIQRSVNGGAWMERGFVHGHGTSNLPRHYMWSERIDATAQRIRYRLRQIDRDGSEELLPAVELQRSASTAHGIRNVYPQPVRGSAHIEYSRLGDGPLSMTLYDLSGRMIQRLVDLDAGSPGSGTVRLLPQELPAGTYLLFMHENGRLHSRSIIIDGR